MVCKDCDATGGVPRLVVLSICIIREIRFHSFAVCCLVVALCGGLFTLCGVKRLPMQGGKRQGGRLLLSRATICVTNCLLSV